LKLHGKKKLSLKFHIIPRNSMKFFGISFKFYGYLINFYRKKRRIIFLSKPKQNSKERLNILIGGKKKFNFKKLNLK
jgi:hypothetical protein